MSRREEVDLMLASACEGCDDGAEHVDVLDGECRTLADEVDERDAIIDKLIAMLEPGEKPTEPFPSASTFEHQSASIKRKLWVQKEAIHARACEIAGRKPNA